MAAVESGCTTETTTNHFSGFLTLPNAQYLGDIGPGDSLVWDRAPGVLQLKIPFIPQRTEAVAWDTRLAAVAPPFTVAAGKEYEIEFSVATVHFTTKK